MINTWLKVEQHLKTFWKGRSITQLRIEEGPILDNISEFSILRFSETREKPYWIYSTLGCFQIDSGHERYEFFLLSPKECPQHELTLSMLAHFHSNSRYRLKLGSIVEIGDPWLPGSTCDHLLISLPYTFGRNLEWLELPDFCVRTLWALPITRSEAEFARREGIESLEQKFDSAMVPYLDPKRHSVV
jgi:hypothetical protein